MESQGLTILVPKSCAHLLRGTEMIWIESGGKGGFKFQNPNEIHDDEEEAGKQQIIPIPEPKTSPDKSPAGPTPIDE